MSVAELKQDLAQRINAYNDEDFLKDLAYYLDEYESAHKVGKLYLLTDEQRTLIRQGKEDIKNGSFLTQEELDAEDEVWFAEEDRKWAGK